jgi:hypothetical protein
MECPINQPLIELLKGSKIVHTETFVKNWWGFHPRAPNIF